MNGKKQTRLQEGADYAALQVQGYSFADIAYMRGLVDDEGKPRRGKVQKALATFHAAQLAQMEAENAALKARVIQLEDERAENVFGHDLGRAWELEGDFVIVGDVHVSTTKWDFAQRPLDIAMRYLPSPRRLIIAGDLLNADSFSSYDNIIPLPSFAQELRAARKFIDTYLTVFDEIYLFLGNHDRRVQKATNNAIAPEDMLRLISHDSRVKISHWGHCVVNTTNGAYRVVHGSEYSINQLVVADQLAAKYQQHIISHHQHHLAVGWSRFKQFLVIDNGGLFDEDSLAYVQLDANKRPRMANGFCMLKDGTPYVFGKAPFTDWNYWLAVNAKAWAA
jgi:hypothetical protein